jgi:hypothetical protein
MPVSLVLKVKIVQTKRLNYLTLGVVFMLLINT